VGVDPQLLAALESNLSALSADDPARGPLHVHLAGLYLTDGRFDDALRHAEGALALNPADAVALSIGAAAAAGSGDDHTADLYRARQAATLEDPAPGPLAEPQHEQPAAPRPVEHSSVWDTTDRLGVTFADVAGMDDVKRRLERSFLAPLRHASLREAFGKSLRGGLMLWGPPGTGKTFLARALSGELGAAFMSATPADIYNQYFGNSEANIARLFRDARSQAPCVVFLDELDAIGGRRSRRNSDMARSVVNQLLSELDGMESNEGVYVLGATNAPWEVDDALRRPGRFDRTVLVLPPDATARRALLLAQLRDRPTTPSLDVESIVAATETYSGADLVRLVENATERAMDRSIAAGAVVSPIQSADLTAALSDTPASTRSWFATAATYATHAAEGEDFGELRDYLRQHRLR
jgi:AAA+ superfamily predicted ATPase